MAQCLFLQTGTENTSSWNSPLYAPERMALTAENSAASLTGVKRSLSALLCG